MVMLIGAVDYEVTKTITAVLSINNTKEGVGSFCGSNGINSSEWLILLVSLLMFCVV